MKFVLLFVLVLVFVIQAVLAAPGEPQTLAVESREMLRVPTNVNTRACNNADCNLICVLLGYSWGSCYDANWCYCYL